MEQPSPVHIDIDTDHHMLLVTLLPFKHIHHARTQRHE